MSVLVWERICADLGIVKEMCLHMFDLVAPSFIFI